MADAAGARWAPSMKPTSSPNKKMHTFFVLMWKHFTVRKVKYIATSFELLSPCLFFIIMAMMRSILSPDIRYRHSNSQPFLETKYYKPEALGTPSSSFPIKILYSPAGSGLTEALMDEVGTRLRLKRLHGSEILSYYHPQRYREYGYNYDRNNGDEKYNGYYTSSDNFESFVTNFTKFMNQESAIVLLEGLGGGVWPQKFKYTIRMENSYYNNDGIDHVGFVRLQWAIDSSYLNLSTGRKISHRVSLQQFPYHPRYDNDQLKITTRILLYACAFTLLFPFAFQMTRLLGERATGIQELIRMMGVSSNILACSHFVNMLPVGLVYAMCATITLKATSSPFVPNTDGFLLFLMLLIHFCSVISLAFVCSYLNKSARLAVTLSVLCFVALWAPTQFYWRLPRPLMMLSGLLPHVPMNWFWYEVEALVLPGGSLDWSTMRSSHSQYSGSVALAFFMMCLQTVLFLTLAWYLSMVIPGKHGVGQRWNFLFQRSYWMKQKVEQYDELEEEAGEEAMSAQEAEYFEDLSGDARQQREVGVRIKNVYKKFGNETALSNVSFDVYKGEITVLLGHNGAGKTTLMSIITGMMSASAGKVTVGGVDVTAGEVRQHLGLCPQHNLFFPDLAVVEHLIFFAMLKGSSYNQAKSSSMDLLTTLGIAEKAHNKSSQLSGGMKRRLQVACALAGGASVLILDEPTSGLDVETRRQLWDLLLTLRGDRTVLLTTHFMEEADALGDRVAALHKGRLRCYATPMHLKKNIGTGYRLSLTTVGLPREPAITRLIASTLDGAILKESSYNSISYNLPAQHSHHFPQLFAALEANRSELGIDSIGVGVSSLEEVFLKLCSDVDTKFTSETMDSSLPEPTYNKIVGLPLYVRQMWVLMLRQAKYILDKKISFCILQMFLPLLAILALTLILNGSKYENKSISMNLDIFSHIFDKKVLYNVGTDVILEDTVQKIACYYKDDVTFQRETNIEQMLAKAAVAEDLTEYNKYVLAVEINDTDVKIHYPQPYTIHNARSVALNLVSNILVAAGRAGDEAGLPVTTYNHPLKNEWQQEYELQKQYQPKEFYKCIIWAVFVAFMTTVVLMYSVALPITERISGARHIHIMSGCSPILHWLVTLLFQTLLYTVLLVLPIAVIAALDKEMTLSQPAFIGALIFILMLGSAAFLSFSYLISFCFGERGAAAFLFSMMLVTGLVPGCVESVFNISKISLSDWAIPSAIINYISPTATMTSALLRAVNVAWINAYCNLNIEKCPKIPAGIWMDVNQCCAEKRGYMCTVCTKGDAPGEQILILTCQLVVYIVLAILTQYGAFNSLYDCIVNMNYRPSPTKFNDDNVVSAENAYVSNAITLPKKQIEDAMFVNKVHKSYFRLIKPSCNAVKGVSFSVKKGECFGLLGVNGAGKSTTFKMITGEECPTRGGAFANGHHLQWPRSQYLKSLGYCPQFFGLDKFLTGRENLSLLLTLRGLAQADVRAETDSWIHVVGLERYSDIPVSGYSGGCMRRLAAAAALSSGAAVTLLDEPTSGVDVSARRRVWVALKRGLRQNRAVIITSHSMDEMEALCDRIAIMSGGSLCALGSPFSLRAAHAKGHALVLKLGSPLAVGDVVNNSHSQLAALKDSLNRKFNCSLKDEHKTMLHYHINETMRYSELFSALEQLKLEFPHLVEDYSVTETTLEEVFLSFAQPSQHALHHVVPLHSLPV